MKKYCLIVGESSQISQFLIPKLTQKEYSIITTYNKKKNKLLKNNSIYLNLENTKRYKFFINKIKKLKIKFDLILFVAAITPSLDRNKNSFLSNLNFEDFKRYLKVNCYSYISITEQLIKEKILNNECKVFFFSTKASSIENRGKIDHHLPGGDILYRISKAALNCAVKNIAFDLSSYKYSFIAYHPGYYNSKIENFDKNMIRISDQFIKIISSKKKYLSGSFIDNDGKSIKW